MTYWRATVERPDGDGGWMVVAVFGTKGHPDGSFAEHLSADTAFDAATLVLGHVWPVNLQKLNERKDLGKWADEREAKTGIADHRITVDVDESKRWSVGYDKPLPDPTTFTVAELRLAEVRAAAADLAAAQAKLKELTDQVRRARNDVRHYKFVAGQAGEESVRAGVPETDVAKARRLPRQPRKKAL